METRSFLSFPRGRTSSSTLPLCAIARPMEPREAMVPSCAEYMSQDLGLCPRKYRIQGLHRTADARLARHRQDITERRKRKDGSGLGLAVLLISVSLGPWPCSGFSPPWSTGGSALLAHPVQSQSAATSCNRWPAARVPNHGGLLSRATGVSHERVSKVHDTTGMFDSLACLSASACRFTTGTSSKGRFPLVHVHGCIIEARSHALRLGRTAAWAFCPRVHQCDRSCFDLPPGVDEHVAVRRISCYARTPGKYTMTTNYLK